MTIAASILWRGSSQIAQEEINETKYMLVVPSFRRTEFTPSAQWNCLYHVHVCRWRIIILQNQVPVSFNFSPHAIGCGYSSNGKKFLVLLAALVEIGFNHDKQTPLRDMRGWRHFSQYAIGHLHNEPSFRSSAKLILDPMDESCQLLP